MGKKLQSGSTAVFTSGQSYLIIHEYPLDADLTDEVAGRREKRNPVLRDVKRETGERTLFRPCSIHTPSSYRGEPCN
jgi:hypothetical protein